MTTSAAVLQLSQVNKRFSGVQALKEVDFELQAGEIHAILGENGAGKSTLIKVITGAQHFDSGSIVLNGQTISPSSPAQAQALGISAVYQEVNLLPNLSVAHNLFLGREPRRFGCIQWREIHRNAKTVLKRFKLDLDVSQNLSSYSVAVQQLIAIARGIDGSAKVLILDEPTASLDSSEVKLLFEVLRGLKQQGVAIVFITHFLDQVYALCDRITVLRNGERIGTFATASLSRTQLIAHMLGRELQEVERSNKSQPQLNDAEPALQVSELSADNRLRSVSFAAGKGQVLGLAGLLGSGRTELCNTLFGMAKKVAGDIAVFDRKVDINNPTDAIKLNLAFCPEDRKAHGIVGPLSVRENIILALQAQRGWWRPLSRLEQKRFTAKMIDDLRIVCGEQEKPIEQLSGGNQQKVILARWLCVVPKVLILDEPTRGIDIGAHADIIVLIQRLCQQGLTVLVASSEIEELVVFSDKILVMRDRRAVAELRGEDISENTIVAAIANSA